GQSWLRVLQPREPQPDELGQPLAEGQRHYHWLAPYHVHRLHDCGQPVPPEAPGSGRLELPRRLHVLVGWAWPARPARGRRVPATSSDPGELPAVHGNGCREPEGTSSRSPGITGLDSAPGALPGSLRRRHVEPGGDFTAREHIQ